MAQLPHWLSCLGLAEPQEGRQTLTQRHGYSLGTLHTLLSRTAGAKSRGTKDLLFLCARAGSTSSSLGQFAEPVFAGMTLLGTS